MFKIQQTLAWKKMNQSQPLCYIPHEAADSLIFSLILSIPVMDGKLLNRITSKKTFASNFNQKKMAVMLRMEGLWQYW